MTNKKSTKEILFSYFSYIILFIGSGFVSGSIVHSGNPTELGKYAIIGILGVSLFIAGQFIQEYILNKENLKKEGLFKFFAFSLMLSVGIGMISGGTQHFSDFPTYSSYLIPLGFTVSLIAYLLKNNYTITRKLWTLIIGMAVLVSIPMFISLNILANNFNTQTAKEKAELCSKKTTFSPFTITAYASETHGTTCPTHSTTKADTDKAMMAMDHNMMNMASTKVTDDKSFIEYVIPHHQDAIDSSTKILATTQDPELKLFLNNVIKTQSQEISTLKTYYKTWLNKDYVDNDSNTVMMKITKTGIEADKEYVSGMIGHHSGIIDIAKTVLTDTKTVYKPEILNLSKQIIKDQESDITLLKKWLVEKYKNVSSTSSQKSTAHNESDSHSDSH